MNIKTSAIIIGLVLFVVGGMIGFVLGIGQREVLAPEPLDPLTNQERKVRMLLGHRTLDSVCANITGRVAEVGEDTIIVSREQDRIELRVEPDTHIARVVPGEPGVAPTREVIELDQIKQGEQIGIYAVITEDGEVAARGITVWPE